NALIAVSAIGAGGVAAATITGQLVASVAIDRFGLFGLDQVSLSPERLLGIALLLVGTVLVVR
ncbi:MAG TPA: DMT family transporter, partial [Solirubrobacterales bacterium]|nr:DMT family transporter [Solirubrobacterales bacterium]